MDSVRLCNDVDSSSQGRSWNAGGKGGRRGAPLVGNQDSSPGSDKPSRLADKDSSMGKRGNWWWEWDVGGGDQQLSIMPNKQLTNSSFFFSCFAILSRASLLLDLLDGTDRHECNCCQLAPTGPSAESNVSAANWVLQRPAQTSSRRLRYMLHTGAGGGCPSKL